MCSGSELSQCRKVQTLHKSLHIPTQQRFCPTLSVHRHLCPNLCVCVRACVCVCVTLTVVRDDVSLGVPHKPTACTLRDLHHVHCECILHVVITHTCTHTDTIAHCTPLGSINYACPPAEFLSSACHPTLPTSCCVPLPGASASAEEEGRCGCRCAQQGWQHGCAMVTHPLNGQVRD